MIACYYVKAMIQQEVFQMKTIHSDSLDRLFHSFLNLETVEECYDYFEDLCTVKEMLDMAQRLDTAVKLSSGMSYNSIKEQSGVSTATIGRVNKCLNYGSGGYKAAIDKLKEKSEK